MGGVHVRQGRAGKFELARGLEAHGGSVAQECDDFAALLQPHPAKFSQALKHGVDAVRPFIGNGGQARAAEGELLVFSADGELALRLAALGEPFGQLAERQACIG